MFNKNFFLGMLTTLVVVIILAVGGLVAVGASRPGSLGGFPDGGRGDHFEQEFGPGGEFGAEGFRGERGGHSHGEFSPLRGLGGILGSLLLIAAVVGVVVGGQWAYRRLRRQPAPAGVVPPVEPADSLDAAAGFEPAAETPADLSDPTVRPDVADDPALETPADPEDNTQTG